MITHKYTVGKERASIDVLIPSKIYTESANGQMEVADWNQNEL